MTVIVFIPDRFPPVAIDWIRQFLTDRSIVLEESDWRDLSTADEHSVDGMSEDTPVYIFGASAYIAEQDFVQHSLEYYETVVKEWARQGINAHIVWLQQNMGGDWSLVLKTTGNALLEIDADRRWREEAREDLRALD